MKNPFDNFCSKNKLLMIFFLCILGCRAYVKEGVNKVYFKPGVLKSVQSYQNGVLNGISREYYQGGTLKHAIHYKDNRIDGMYHTYYPSVALWTKEIYNKGVFVGRTEYNEDGEVIKEESFGED